MSTTKTPCCFRLSEEAIQCLDQLEVRCLDFRSRTDIVEQAIIQLWDRQLGMADYAAKPNSLL